MTGQRLNAHVVFPPQTTQWRWLPGFQPREVSDTLAAPSCTVRGSGGGGIMHLTNTVFPEDAELRTVLADLLDDSGDAWGANLVGLLRPKLLLDGHLGPRTQPTHHLEPYGEPRVRIPGRRRGGAILESLVPSPSSEFWSTKPT